MLFLKPVPEGNTGQAKLPTEVRNNMGFAKVGGQVKKLKKGGKVKRMSCPQMVWQNEVTILKKKVDSYDEMSRYGKTRKIKTMSNGGKTGTKKDACYHKVKASYKVFFLVSRLSGKCHKMQKEKRREASSS